MYLYLVGFILMISFTLYYFNYDPFTKDEPIDTSTIDTSTTDTLDIENSINELKSLNEYINNGTAHRAALS